MNFSVKLNRLNSLKTILDKFKLLLNMTQTATEFTNKVYVRNVENEDRIQISFKYSNPSYGILEDKVFNFSRLKSEELEKSTVRISANVSKQVSKKLTKNLKKTKNKTAPAPSEGNEHENYSMAENIANEDNSLPSEDNLLPICVLSKDGGVLEGSTFNDEAWRHGGSLRIGNQDYFIEMNSPTLKLISLPQIIMSGYSVVPRVDLEFASLEDSKFKWYVQKQTHAIENDSSNAKKFKVNQSRSGDKIKAEDWRLVSEDFMFTPGDEHLNAFIKFSCVPREGCRMGEEVAVVSKCRVEEGPKNCPFEKRHQFTQQLCGDDSFRVVCYNILADLYADSDYSRDHLFSYCPPHFLCIDYRKQLILKELIGYNSDLLCLQEVDRKLFEGDLKLMLHKCGFEGLLRTKTGEVSEGCATFFRSSKFKFISSHDMPLNDFLKTDPGMKAIVDALEANETMKTKMADRNTVLQATLLATTTTSTPTRHLLVGTVHLYFHHRASHVRLLQTHLAITYLQQLLCSLKQQQNIEAHLIYCGDFNAYAGSGVHEYLTGNVIPPTHADWFTGGKAEYLPGLTLKHNLDLVNLSGSPAYTNYVGGFNACLDYIYASSTLTNGSTIPLPSHHDVTTLTALPNQLFPSDHLAIGCDVKWPNQ